MIGSRPDISAAADGWDCVRCTPITKPSFLANRWINPFYWLPRSRRRLGEVAGRRTAKFLRFHVIANKRTAGIRGRVKIRLIVPPNPAKFASGTNSPLSNAV